MRLIIAEKPSVGRDLASALGRHRKEKVPWLATAGPSAGRSGTLPSSPWPDAYGEQYKKWRLESLPILPERFMVGVNRKTRDQFSVVKKLLRATLP